jgi:DNA-binding NarL/FixJ family response regulator
MSCIIRVFLADDHTLVRAWFRNMPQVLRDVELIAEAENGREALRLIEERRPNMVPMDIAMLGLNGLKAATRVSKDFPGVRVVILSMHANEEYVLRAFRASVAGYHLKDTKPAELELPLKAVVRGETYLSSRISRQITECVQHTGGENSHLKRLTPRQREVLQLIAEGHTSREIAHTLSISVKTVEIHRAGLMDRLGIHDIAGLVRYGPGEDILDLIPCPLVFPEPTGSPCPIQHKNWPKGCVTTLVTSVGAVSGINSTAIARSTRRSTNSARPPSASTLRL